MIWWKRIPGGDYVYPVQATVLAVTAKRVKIEAEDDGDMVIRYVPWESLQRQGCPGDVETTRLPKHGW